MIVHEVLHQVVARLDALGISYMVSGSAVSSFYASMRSTYDGDLVISMRADQVEDFAKTLEKDFYLDRASIRRSLQLGGSFNLIHLESALKIDFFPLRSRTFSQEEFSRRKRELISERSTVPVFISTPEDTVLSKLEWFRAGGEVSENQWNDVKGILRMQGDHLDLAYLRHWAQDLRVDDLLAKAIEEARR